MSEWTRKRFWTTAEVARCEGGYEVQLDGRRLLTPGKSPLVLPGRAMAEAVAAEWAAQDEKVDPGTMPMTRMANSALEKVPFKKAEVAEMLAEFGETDLLCYRAESPAELVALQSAAWDPLLDWAAQEFDAPLVIATGVMYVPQPRESLARLAACVHRLDTWELTAFHDLVSLTGSLVLGFAALAPIRPRSDLWALSRLDETWQEQQWGRDEQAAELASQKKAAFLDAGRFYDLRKTA